MLFSIISEKIEQNGTTSSSNGKIQLIFSFLPIKKFPHTNRNRVRELYPLTRVNLLLIEKRTFYLLECARKNCGSLRAP